MAKNKGASSPDTKPKPDLPRKKDENLVKGESMRIRVSKADKDVLEQAATRVGLGVSAFVLSAAMEKARTALGS